MALIICSRSCVMSYLRRVGLKIGGILYDQDKKKRLIWQVAATG
jgi:hypothetical protein